MKRAVSLLVLLVLVGSLSACASTGGSGIPGQRALQGAVLGAAVGAGVGAAVCGGECAKVGAAVGAAVGGVGGAIIGTQEQATAYSQPLPLESLRGKRVAIVAHPQFGYYGTNVVKPIIEEQLILRGAGAVFDLPQYPSSQNQQVTVDLLAEVATQERYNSAELDLRILDAGTRQVLAVGSAREPIYSSSGFGYTYDPRTAALRTAAKAAVWGLTPLKQPSPTPPPSPKR